MRNPAKITTPIPSPEDIAADLGITERRLNDLLAILEHGARKSSSGPIAKNSAPPKSADNLAGKRGRSSR